MVVGKFIDSRDFEVEEIQEWVDLWLKKERIVVKEGKFFLFFCQNYDDRQDILGMYGNLNFNGALLVFKP